MPRATRRPEVIQRRGGTVRAFLENWTAHIVTVLLVAIVVVVAPRQTTLLAYKACLPMIGACGGYWLCTWFLGRCPEEGEAHERWQLVTLMCAGMLAMGLGA